MSDMPFVPYWPEPDDPDDWYDYDSFMSAADEAADFDYFVPADPDPRQEDVDDLELQLLTALGAIPDEVVIDIDKVAEQDFGNLRGKVFQTLIEGIRYLLDVGLISFANLVKMDDGTFRPLVGDTGNRKRRKRARRRKKRS